MTRLHRLARTTDLAATAAEADRALVRGERTRLIEAMHHPLDHAVGHGASLAATRRTHHAAIAAGERRLDALRERERALDALVIARRRRAEQVTTLARRADRIASDRLDRLDALATDDLVSSRIARSKQT